MADEEIKWLVKNKDGQTEGPFSTLEIINKIRAGYYQGEESISLYPSGQWRAISYEEAFFSELLEVLEEELNDDRKRVEMPPPPSREKQPPKRRKWGDEIVPEVQSQDTPAMIDVQPNSRVQKKIKEKSRRGRAVEERQQKLREFVERRQGDERRSKGKRDSRSLREIRSAKRRFRYFLIAIITLAMGYVFLSEPARDYQGERIRLAGPKLKRKGKTKPLASLRKGVDYFKKDTLKDYIKAQNIFISHIEAKKSMDAISFLCMTYRELWPVAYQDTKDIETVQAVLRMAQVENPESTAASTCLVVKEWVLGRYQEALRIMDVYLRKQKNLIFFNQMSGDVKAASKLYSEANFYFEQVTLFWEPKPVWAKTLLQLARVKRKMKKSDEAKRIYIQLLKHYPKHAVAQIEKGIVEFEFNQYGRAQKNIRTGLVENQRIPKAIEAEAYFTLAKIHKIKGDRRRALKSAQKAFSIDSSLTDAKQFVLKLGGMKALNDITIDNVNMVYLGEQFMKMGQYTKAQGQFRAAFEADTKNAFAALRAGQALWRLNQGKEAIIWVRKAVVADPKLIRAYIVLADYLSQRYDYLNAIATLKQAKRVNPKHHEVWRGFALVELRRRNYQGAVVFAEKALKKYDTDIESHLILAEAHHELRDEEKAYKYIETAAELDRSNEDVIALKAKILVALQGSYAGEIFIQQMIDEYSDKLSFRRTLGNIYMQEQKFDEAIAVFNEILAIDGNDKPALMQMAKVLQMKAKKDSYAEAREYLMQAAALDPSDAEPIFQLGKLYLDAGQAGYANNQFDRVIQVNSRYPLAYYYSGLALLKMGRYKDAIAMSKQENANNPDIPEPFLLSGEANFKMSIYSKDVNLRNAYASQCAKDYKEAIVKGYRYADSYIWLARCLRLTGALDSAESMLDEAQKLESGNPDIYREVGAINEMRGHIDKAILGYNRYLQLAPTAKDIDEIKKRVNRLQLKGQQK